MAHAGAGPPSAAGFAAADDSRMSEAGAAWPRLPALAALTVSARASRPQPASVSATALSPVVHFSTVNVVLGSARGAAPGFCGWAIVLVLPLECLRGRQACEQRSRPR